MNLRKNQGSNRQLQYVQTEPNEPENYNDFIDLDFERPFECENSQGRPSAGPQQPTAKAYPPNVSITNKKMFNRAQHSGSGRQG
jgi:hypothetical protein